MAAYPNPCRRSLVIRFFWVSVIKIAHLPYLASLIAQAQAAAEDYCRTKFSDPAPEPVRLAVLLMVGFYYENRDIPDMTTYKAMRMAFDSLLYPYRDPEKMF